MFPDLQSGSAEATINMSGYESQTISNLEIDGYNVLQVYLSQ
jgi:hypothetical protein